MSESHLEVVRKARERLQNQEMPDRHGDNTSAATASSGGRTPGAPNPNAKDDKVLMYRGRVVRGGGGGAPGAPRGGRPAPRTGGGGAGGGAKERLQQLSDLFNDGLLTKAEYDAKRRQIIDNM